MKNYLAWAGFAFGILGLLASALGVDDLINQLAPFHGNKAIVSKAVTIAAAFLVAWGLALIGRYVLRRLVTSVQSRLALRGSFEIGDCDDEYITEISRIGMVHFGRSATDERDTKRLHSIDPLMFSVLLDGEGRLRGYFCIIKLSVAGVAALLRNEFSLTNLPREYIRADKKQSYQNVYIGAIVGDSVTARANAIVAVNLKLQSMRPTSIYARAATKDGLRLLLKHGFVCLRAGGGIGDLYRKNIALRHRI